MAKYAITYHCGHEAIEQLYGKNAEREKYIEYAQHAKLCPSCYAVAQATARATEAATYATQTADYPPLTGSEKQVAWALTIRGKFLEAIAALPQRDSEGLSQVDTAIRRQTDSRWWIDQRHNLDNAIIGLKTLVNADTPLREYLEAQRARKAHHG